MDEVLGLCGVEVKDLHSLWVTNKFAVELWSGPQRHKRSEFGHQMMNLTTTIVT